jgi:hypothetical protein
LTTHLSRLINILWLPLCRINKFGFYFPRRLLRSPILVGHQHAADAAHHTPAGVGDDQEPPPPAAQPQLAEPPPSPQSAVGVGTRRNSHAEHIVPTALSRHSATGTGPAAAGHQRPLSGGLGQRRRGKVGWGGAAATSMVPPEPPHRETTRGLGRIQKSYMRF